MNQILNLDKWNSKHKLIRNLHIIILILCLILIVMISIDIFKKLPPQTHALYMKVQFWICIAFIIDFFAEWIFSKQKKRYFFTHILFLIVSIPYLDIFAIAGTHFNQPTDYLLRFIPLIRGGYALAIIVSWLSYSSASTLIVTYVTILLSTVYFSSLLFFNVEHDMNPLVLNYTDAIWWAFMNVTTVGSNIYAISGLGRILSVVLSAMGMMMFPIGTAYITSRISKEDIRKRQEYEEMFGEVGEMTKKEDEKEKQLAQAQQHNDNEKSILETKMKEAGETITDTKPSTEPALKNTTDQNQAADHTSDENNANK